MAERLSYRPAEVRKLIGIGRTKLRELLSSGEIESFSVGRARLVSRAAIERWVNHGEGAATQAGPVALGHGEERPAASISSRRKRQAPGTTR